MARLLMSQGGILEIYSDEGGRSRLDFVNGIVLSEVVTLQVGQFPLTQEVVAGLILNILTGVLGSVTLAHPNHERNKLLILVLLERN